MSFLIDGKKCSHCGFSFSAKSVHPSIHSITLPNNHLVKNGSFWLTNAKDHLSFTFLLLRSFPFFARSIFNRKCLWHLYPVKFSNVVVVTRNIFSVLGSVWHWVVADGNKCPPCTWGGGHQKYFFASSVSWESAAAAGSASFLLLHTNTERQGYAIDNKNQGCYFSQAHNNNQSLHRTKEVDLHNVDHIWPPCQR